ncbi:MAG: aminotransferase class IV [Puniceicoccales bacterium]|nr:aminotransferase class IV [Puniceicoccales bacterium]
MKIYVDGTFYGEGDACISVLDKGFRFGMGLRGRFICRGGKFFRLDEHIDWLKAVAEKNDVEFSWDIPELKESMAATYDANRFGKKTAAVELILTAGAAEPSAKRSNRKSKNSVAPGSVVILAEELSDTKAAVPIKLGHVDDQAISAMAIAEERSRLCRGETLRVKRLAAADGAVGGVVMGPGGAVCACSEGELFAVSDGRPWVADGSPASFVKTVALELLEEIDYPCAIRPAKLRDMASAAECFVINDLFELLPVSAIGKNSFGDGNIGSVTAAIGEALAKKIGGKLKDPF